MTFVRSSLFNLFFYLWLGIGGSMGLPFFLMPRRLSFYFAKFWCGGVMVLLRIFAGLDYRVVGTVPAGKVIVAPKHQSAWDTLIFLLMLKRPAYVLKRELFNLPFYGWFSRKMGMIGVDRDGGASALKGMLTATRNALADGRPIVIFPQGTRTPAGSGKPYHPGIYAIYRDAGVPVIPVALNSGSFWAKNAYFKYSGTITLEYLEPIPPGLDRKTFMERLEGTIEPASAALAALASRPQAA